MAIDSTREIRRAGLARQKATAALTAIVGNRIYGQAAPPNPTWPFTVWGSLTLIPLRASCLDGSEGSVVVHGFAKQRMADGVMVETAEDHASRLGAAIAAALDGHFTQIDGGTASFQWTRGQLLIDGAEADAFHTIQNFRIRCMTSRIS